MLNIPDALLWRQGDVSLVPPCGQAGDAAPLGAVLWRTPLSNQVEKARFDGIMDLIWLCNLALDYCLGIVPLVSSLGYAIPLSP
ncbi:hypothetical protein Q7C36_008002 [Tachysurus vachellii]|uniref:Uncharacterized protein n=1 Tax=Tachysurus vachellii TaxID=175792 RepID=A0AA88NCH4_TACVA|nr:hypothetical protein Q7C36_008002 [Tachysurus vachellii]